jgi:3-hydroxyisobutyrate dehydrogenase-like beta-hydroxyacid dehydrogenase
MTTSKPSLAVRIYEEFKKRGAYALDAPVSGILIEYIELEYSIDS